MPQIARLGRGAALTVALALAPNNPATYWYAAPEEACDLVTSEQDQWRCDEAPVAWGPHAVASVRPPGPVS